MSLIKCLFIIVLSIIGPLNFSPAEEVKIQAEKVEAFTVDPATGNRTDLVFNKRSHRWEVPISSLERAINPLAVKMPESFFIRDPKTGNTYPVRWEPYHQYVWGMDDRSSDLKNPPVEFIANYYPPGEYSPPGGGGWWYSNKVRAEVSSKKSQGLTLTVIGPAAQPQSQSQWQIPTRRESVDESQWQIPVFKGKRRSSTGRHRDYPIASPPPSPSPPSGARDVRTGEYYPPAAGGVTDPKTGTFYQDVPGGYINTRTGEFYPKTGGK
jgi:hypothetical protein